MYQFIRRLRRDLPYSKCILFQESQMKHIVGIIRETNSAHSYLNRYNMYALDKYKLNEAENDKAYLLYNLNNQIYLKGYLIGRVEEDGWFEEYDRIKEYNPRLLDMEFLEEDFLRNLRTIEMNNKVIEELAESQGYNNKESELKNMLFNYENLEACAGTGQGLGSWKGTSVFSISKRNIWKTESKNAYIIYDMENKLYKDGYVLGTVDIHGDIDMYDTPISYGTLLGEEKRTYTYEEPKPYSGNMSMKNETGVKNEPLDEGVILKKVNDAVDALLAEACKW